MILISIADLLRVLFAFLFVFLALPLLVEGHRLWRGEPFQLSAQVWAPIVLRAFVQASFAAETAAMLLGVIRLCLPGVVIVSCLALCVRGAWVAHKRRLAPAESASHAVWSRVIHFLEGRGSLRLSSQLVVFPFRPPRLSHTSRWMLAVTGIVLLIGIARPLQQAHFDHEETYLRAVSLAALTQGQAWNPDGSIALLAPLVSFSGLNAAPVVRFAGPILATVALLILAFLVWQLWQKPVTASLALILFSGLLFSSANGSWELLPGSIAAVYAICAGAISSYSLRDGLLAAATALMLAPRQWIPFLACVLLILFLFASARARMRVNPLPLALLASLTAFGAVIYYQHASRLTQVYQYESAASTCEAIGRQFHRNEWLVVSPFHELACTYGQGWHIDLSEFVSKFTADQVSKPDFQFPYGSVQVFFFIERHPLRVGPHTSAMDVSWRYAPAESEEWSAYLYGDPLGRASLEYQAAELLNAYGSTHSNLAVFYEDENLVVLKLLQTPANTKESNGYRSPLLHLEQSHPILHFRSTYEATEPISTEKYREQHLSINHGGEKHND